MIYARKRGGDCHLIGDFPNARVLTLMPGGDLKVAYEGPLEVIDNWVIGQGVMFSVSSIWKIEEIKP